MSLGSSMARGTCAFLSLLKSAKRSMVCFGRVGSTQSQRRDSSACSATGRGVSRWVRNSSLPTKRIDRAPATDFATYPTLAAASQSRGGEVGPEPHNTQQRPVGLLRLGTLTAQL